MRTPGSLAVRQVDPALQEDWNQQIRTFPHRNAFHSAEWAAVLAEAYGYRAKYFVADSESEFASVLPVMEVESRWTGKRGISLPFTDECLPLQTSREAQAATFQAAIEHGKANGWRYFELRGETESVRDLPGAFPSMTFYTHHLKLKGDASDLFGMFDPAVRRAIRRSEKSGVQSAFSTSADAMEEYYRLHCLTRKTHGLPPQPVRFFRNIQSHLIAKGHGIIVQAIHQGRVIASSIFLLMGSEAIYKFGASDPSFQNLRGNNLVMWNGIQWCLQKGASFLNFGRTSLSNEGLRRFKLSWGAEEKQLHYYKYDLQKNIFMKDHDATDGWHTTVFRTMPIFANRLAGSLLYRHIA